MALLDIANQRSGAKAWSPRKCVADRAGDRRLASGTSQVGFSSLTAVWGWFCQAGKPDLRNTPAFCESTESTESADTANAFLLAFSMNASGI